MLIFFFSFAPGQGIRVLNISEMLQLVDPRLFKDEKYLPF